MKFSEESQAPETSFTPKEVYLGKAAYKVIAVNPNNEVLKSLGQYTTDDEPVYTFKREINGQEYDAVNITIYLQSPTDVNIIDRVTYTVVNNVQLSSTNKLAVINKYGGDTWLEQSFLDSKTVPDNMQWYLNEGVKPAKRGEKELVGFIRALRNFKNVSIESTPEDKENYVSLFEESDLQKLFKGDYSDIRKVLMSNPDAKVGFLLGARSSDAGKVYQDTFKEMPLRPYMVNNANNDYLVKRVTEAQANGKYANTYFDLADLSYKKYDANSVSTPKADTEEDDDQLPF